MAKSRKQYITTYKTKKPKSKSRSKTKSSSAKEPKKSAKVQKKEFLLDNQKKLLSKYMKDYSELSVDQLKELLMKNRQVKSGNKKDLANRCAEGKLLGGLTNCPKCLGGKFKFNIKNGEYFCKGYMDDDVFKNCHYKSLTAERSEWQD